MIYLFLANGFEEIEAAVTVDLLRRAELSVALVGVGGRTVTGAHGMTLLCDLTEEEADPADPEMVVLIGGVPGTLLLERSPMVAAYIDLALSLSLPVGAIGVAPTILGHMGLLAGRRATCTPGFEEQLFGAQVTGNKVEVDGLFLTAEGPGAAMDFGLALVECLMGKERADLLGASLQWVR